MQGLEEILGSSGLDLGSLGARFGLNPDQTRSAMGSLVPAVVGGFHKQAQAGDPAGVADAVNAVQQPDAAAGNDVLGRIFGNKDVSRQVADHASGQSGVSSTVLKAMLPIVAAAVARHLAGNAQGAGAGGLGGGGLGGGGLRWRLGRHARFDLGRRRRRQQRGRARRAGRPWWPARRRRQSARRDPERHAAMRRALAAAAVILALAGCDGPNEKAGKDKDKAAAAASGVPHRGDGPNQQLGKAQDRAADAAKDARDARASALRKQAQGIKAQADVEADRLEEQARAIRAKAKDSAAPLEQQAKSVRAQP